MFFIHPPTFTGASSTQVRSQPSGITIQYSAFHFLLASFPVLFFCVRYSRAGFSSIKRPISYTKWTEKKFVVGEQGVDTCPCDRSLEFRKLCPLDLGVVDLSVHIRWECKHIEKSILTWMIVRDGGSSRDSESRKSLI